LPGADPRGPEHTLIADADDMPKSVYRRRRRAGKPTAVPGSTTGCDHREIGVSEAAADEQAPTTRRPGEDITA